MAQSELTLSQEYAMFCPTHNRFEAAVALVGPATYRTKDGCVIKQSLVYDHMGEPGKKGTTLHPRDQVKIAEFLRGYNVTKEA